MHPYCNDEDHDADNKFLAKYMKAMMHALSGQAGFENMLRQSAHHKIIGKVKERALTDTMNSLRSSPSTFDGAKSASGSVFNASQLEGTRSGFPIILVFVQPLAF